MGVIYVERKKGSATVDTLKTFASGMRKTEVIFFRDPLETETKKPCSKAS